jgi:hypothetical protein
MLRLPNVFAPAGLFSIDEHNHIFLMLMDNIIHLLFVQCVRNDDYTEIIRTAALRKKRLQNNYKYNS